MFKEYMRSNYIQRSHKLYFFWYGADVIESFTENDEDSLGSAAQSRRRTIEGRVTCSQNDDGSMQGRQRRFAMTHS